MCTLKDVFLSFNHKKNKNICIKFRMTLICSKLCFFLCPLCRIMKEKQTQAQICCRSLTLPCFISYSLPANNKPSTSLKQKPQGNW